MYDLRVIVILTALATNPLWMPILAWAMRQILDEFTSLRRRGGQRRAKRARRHSQPGCAGTAHVADNKCSAEH